MGHGEIQRSSASPELAGWVESIGSVDFDRDVADHANDPDRPICRHSDASRTAVPTPRVRPLRGLVPIGIVDSRVRPLVRGSR